MALIDGRKQTAGSTMGGDSAASSVNEPRGDSDGDHSELNGLQSMRELQLMLKELESAETRENLSLCRMRDKLKLNRRVRLRTKIKESKNHGPEESSRRSGDQVKTLGT